MLHYRDLSPKLAEMLIAAGAQIDTIDKVIIFHVQLMYIIIIIIAINPSLGRGL